MYYIHKYTWTPGKYVEERLYPGYNTHAEARKVMRSFKEITHTSYEIKEETNAN